MKIYCNRQKDDSQIFDSIVGRDIWIKVHCSTNEYGLLKGNLWCKLDGVLDNPAYGPYKFYAVDWIHESLTDKNTGIVNDYLSEEFRNQPFHNSGWICEDFVSIIRPIEFLTTDELFNL